jgi:hypothetical protein
MSEADLIRREDVMPAFEAASDKYNENKDGRWFRHHMADAIAAIPPAPDVAALVEAGKYLSDVIDVLLDDCRSQTDDVIIKTITGAKIRSVADARAALAAWEGRGNE